MGVAEYFSTFCNNISISQDTRSDISNKYCRITKQLNKDFYGIDSETLNSFYTGSFGRGTAQNGFSDLDMIFVLPNAKYHQYNKHTGNGQSALLQEVRNSIGNTYSSTKVSGDGQVVVVEFTSNITFEVVPAFLNTSNKYTYPDSNSGGSWKETNPKPEIAEINRIDNNCNNNLKQLCKMMRAWKIFNNVPMGGLLIDTLASRFISNWEYRNKSFLYYDYMSRDFLDYLANEDDTKSYWSAVGSGQQVYPKGNFSYKARVSYNNSLEAINYQTKNQDWSANQSWRNIFGYAFPQ